MEGRLVFKNCSVFRPDGRVREAVAVVVERRVVTKVAPDAEVPVLPGDWEIAGGGRLLGPGLVDCHTHLVGGQVLPASGELLLLPEQARFERQARAATELSAGEVEALTALALAQNLRRGVTLSVEHLQAPGDVAGALAVQARVAERLGARLVNSHATAGGVGKVPALEQLEANAEHARSYRYHPTVRGALGFYASHCCDDELLRQVGRLREQMGVGVHYHLGESEEDLALTYARYQQRIVPRLETFGLLSAGAVGAYGRVLDRAEAERLAKNRTLVALSPRLSLAGETGSHGFEALLAEEGLLGLGTAGQGTLWDELTCAFLAAMAVARVGRLLDPDGLLADLLMGAPAELCSMLFSLPSGTVEEGSLADLVLFDLVPGPGAPGLAPSQMLKLGQATVAWTVVDGRVVVREGQLLGADYGELAQQASLALASLWRRLWPGESRAP